MVLVGQELEANQLGPVCFSLLLVFVVFHFKYIRHLQRLSKKSAKHGSQFHKKYFKLQYFFINLGCFLL